MSSLSSLKNANFCINFDFQLTWTYFLWRWNSYLKCCSLHSGSNVVTIVVLLKVGFLWPARLFCGQRSYCYVTAILFSAKSCFKWNKAKLWLRLYSQQFISLKQNKYTWKPCELYWSHVVLIWIQIHHRRQRNGNIAFRHSLTLTRNAERMLPISISLSSITFRIMFTNLSKIAQIESHLLRHLIDCMSNLPTKFSLAISSQLDA